MKEPRICAIVLTYNGKYLIAKMLKSFRKTIYKNGQVIVVDNGGSDGSEELIKKKFSWAKVVRLQLNKGFAGGNNVGIRYAFGHDKPEYVVLLNDDMEIIDPKWLNILVETAKKTGAGVTGCKLVLLDGRIQYAGGYFHPVRITMHRGLLEADNGQYDEELEVDYANGACFLINKDVISRIGLLDEGYSPIYFEEADYCARARQAGFKIIYTGKTKLIHYTSLTTKKEGNTQRYYIWEKNRIRFVQRHFSFLWKIAAHFRILSGVLWVGKDTPGSGVGIAKRLQLLKKAFQDAKK